MSKLKLKINVKVPQLLCIVVSVALKGEFERFGGFCVDCYYTLSSIGVGGTKTFFKLDFLSWIFCPGFFVLDFSTLTPNYRIKYSN